MIMSTLFKCLLVAFDHGTDRAPGLGRSWLSWQRWAMSQIPSRGGASPETDANDPPAPITVMLSSRLMVLANLLKRGAILRYKRLAGLSSVEFGLVASL